MACRGGGSWASSGDPLEARLRWEKKTTDQTIGLAEPQAHRAAGPGEPLLAGASPWRGLRQKVVVCWVGDIFGCPSSNLGSLWKKGELLLFERRRQRGQQEGVGGLLHSRIDSRCSAGCAGSCLCLPTHLEGPGPPLLPPALPLTYSAPQLAPTQYPPEAHLWRWWLAMPTPSQSPQCKSFFFFIS